MKYCHISFLSYLNYNKTMESSPHLEKVTFQEKLSEEIRAEIDYLKHNREARKANKELMDNFVRV